MVIYLLTLYDKLTATTIPSREPLVLSCTRPIPLVMGRLRAEDVVRLLLRYQSLISAR